MIKIKTFFLLLSLFFSSFIHAQNPSGLKVSLGRSKSPSEALNTIGWIYQSTFTWNYTIGISTKLFHHNSGWFELSPMGKFWRQSTFYMEYTIENQNKFTAGHLFEIPNIKKPFILYTDAGLGILYPFDFDFLFHIGLLPSWRIDSHFQIFTGGMKFTFAKKYESSQFHILLLGFHYNLIWY